MPDLQRLFAFLFVMNAFEMIRGNIYGGKPLTVLKLLACTVSLKQQLDNFARDVLGGELFSAAFYSCLHAFAGIFAACCYISGFL